MSAGAELALAVLHAEEGGEIDPDHFGPAFADVVAGTTPADAMATLAELASSPLAIDRFAVAQGLVLGSRLEARDGGLDEPLTVLAQAVVAAHGDTDAAPAPAPAARLVDAVTRLQPGVTLDAVTYDGFVEAFGGALEVTSGPAGIALSGPASTFVATVTELATNLLSCRSAVHVHEGRQVLLVELDACSNLPFDTCAKAIDPRRWPECSPMFISVAPVTTPVTTPTGWAGVVREVVGIQGFGVYTTDLAVTYRREPGLALTAYDLADQRNDDGRVTVDHGFVSATDEGVHRRLRALKVYRIEGLHTPPSWICPLWAKQAVMAGWWCA
jgi:hypothetical protein